MRIWFVLGACLAARVAIAEPPAEPPAPVDPAAAARLRWQHGSVLYDLGKYPQAIAEFEAAYELDPDPSYLFAIAQAERLDHHDPRAIELYRRYLDLRPDDPKRAEILRTIADLERRVRADERAAAKQHPAAPPADPVPALAAHAPAAADKHVRVAIDVGTSVIFLQGLDADPRSPALGGRLGVTYVRRIGGFVLDVGGTWQLTTIPYDELDDAGDRTRGASVLFSQLHAVGAISRTIAGPVWARLGLGLGMATFGNLKMGNPVTPGQEERDDIHMPCVRIDSVVGYRYNATLDFVLGVASASVSARNDRLDDRIDRVSTYEGFYLGVYIKL